MDSARFGRTLTHARHRRRARSGDEVVLLAPRGADVETLDDVVVHRHVAVVEEARERDAGVGEAAKRDAEPRPRRLVLLARASVGPGARSMAGLTNY